MIITVMVSGSQHFWTNQYSIVLYIALSHQVIIKNLNTWRDKLIFELIQMLYLVRQYFVQQCCGADMVLYSNKFFKNLKFNETLAKRLINRCCTLKKTYIYYRTYGQAQFKYERPGNNCFQNLNISVHYMLSIRNVSSTYKSGFYSETRLISDQLVIDDPRCPFFWLLMASPFLFASFCWGVVVTVLQWMVCLSFFSVVLFGQDGLNSYKWFCGSGAYP